MPPEIPKIKAKDLPYLNGRVLDITYKKNDIRCRTPKMKRSAFSLPLLVTGCGRSGTTWLAKTFQKSGFDVPHEYVGDLGTVSWYFFTDSDWSRYHYWHMPKGRAVHMGERRSDFKFYHVVHLVRHPLKVIASGLKVHLLSDYEYVADAGADTDMEGVPREHRRLLRSMRMVEHIYASVEEQTDDVIRLEDVPANWSRLAMMLGDSKATRVEIPPNNKSSGYKKATPLTWKELSDVDKLLSKQLKRRASGFGY